MKLLIIILSKFSNTTAIYDTLEMQRVLVTVIQKIVPGIPSNQYEITPKDENYIFLGGIQKCRKALLDTIITPKN